ncbi:MAG: hypothetical protein J6I96_07035 [Oscillospiraceae bacterium]|nr:hypothetical protein [Oscillospiraceae bacterium]
MKAVIMGIIAMALIYAVIVFLPRIAGAVDKAFAKVKTTEHNDGLYDIYSLHNDDKDDKNDNDEDKKE